MYKKKNVVILSNYIGAQKQRTVIVYDYRTEQVFSLSEPGLNGWVSPENSELKDVNKLDLISIELRDKPSADSNYEYKLGSVLFVGNHVNFKKLLKKTDDVYCYRNSNHSPRDIRLKRNLAIVKVMQRPSFDTYTLMNIRNMKILQDKKYHVPKFLYKHTNGSYTHLHIKEPICNTLLDNNFSGMAVMHCDKAKNVKTIVALIGDTKEDKVAQKEEKWLQTISDIRKQEADCMQMQFMQEIEKHTLEVLYMALNAKFRTPAPLCPFYDKVHDDREVCSCLEKESQAQGSTPFLMGKVIQIVAKHLYGDHYTLPQLLHVASVGCGGINALCLNNFDWIESMAEKLYSSQHNNSLSSLYKEIDQSCRMQPFQENRSGFKRQVNEQWPQFFYHPEGPSLNTFVVYIFDDISDPEFALNYETISIHKKLEEVPFHAYPALDDSSQKNPEVFFCEDQ